jgi:hypothetical protein
MDGRWKWRRSLRLGMDNYMWRYDLFDDGRPWRHHHWWRGRHCPGVASIVMTSYPV